MNVLHSVGALIAVCCACAGLDSRPLRPVEFRIVDAFDAPGDTISFESVQCDRPTIEPGATMHARGRFHLDSMPQATLYFGLTNGQLTADSPPQVEAGDGIFDLVLHVVEPGHPHVSFYAGSGANKCIGKQRFEIVAGAR